MFLERLCSSQKPFNRHLESLRESFGKIGYPKKLFDNQLNQFKKRKTEQLNDQLINRGIAVPLVLKYHLRFSNLSHVIIALFVYLYVD